MSDRIPCHDKHFKPSEIVVAIVDGQVWLDTKRLTPQGARRVAVALARTARAVEAGEGRYA